MNLLFAINGAVTLLISLLLAFGFFKHYRKERVSKLIHWFSIIFFSYFILFLFSLFWFLGYFDYSKIDFNLIYSLVVLVQTVVLFKVSYLLHGEKKLFYWLFFYVGGLLSVYISFSYFPAVILVISFFLTLILSFNMISSFSVLRRVGFAGILYSCTSLIMVFFLFFGIGEAYFFSITSNIIFVFFVYFFLKDIRKFPVSLARVYRPKGDHGVLLFVKYFIFIIVLTNLVLVTTISVHEFSHVSVSRYYGCESKTIVYDEGMYPYSEIVCTDLSNRVPITLAGPVVPIVIAIFLFIIGGRYIRPISFLVLGFNLLASYRDLGEIGLSDNLVVTSTILGLIFLSYGLVILAKTRIQDNSHHVV